MRIMIPLLMIAVVGGGLISVLESSFLPGGFLFPVKIFVENIKFGLAQSAEEKVSLHLQFADERIAEINYMLSKRKINSKGLMTGLVEFENHILESDLLVETERKNGKDVSGLSVGIAVATRGSELGLKFQEYRLKARKDSVNSAISKAELKGENGRSDILLAERKGFLKAKKVFDSELQRMEGVFDKIGAARTIREAEFKKQRLIEEARLRGVKIPINLLLEIEDSIALADRAYLLDQFEEAENQAFSARSTIRFLGTVLNRI